jgi:integrase
MNHHVLPALGDLRLLELTRGGTQRFMTALAGKGLERQSMKNIWTTLSAVLSTAVEYGYLERNPARGVKLGAREPRQDRFIPSPNDFCRLVGHLAELARTVVLLLAGTGMRIGEAMALRVEDVDLENLEIHIRQDVWHGHLGSPKSEASAATVPIGPKLASVLRQHLAGLGRETGFLFSNEQGRPLDPKYLAQKLLYPVLESLGLPRFSWHTLRHLHATRLGINNVPVRVAQAQLRHSDPAVTLGVYTHVVEESRRRAGELVENDLFSIVLSLEEEAQATNAVETTK